MHTRKNRSRILNSLMWNYEWIQFKTLAYTFRLSWLIYMCNACLSACLLLLGIFAVFRLFLFSFVFLVDCNRNQCTSKFNVSVCVCGPTVSIYIMCEFVNVYFVQTNKKHKINLTGQNTIEGAKFDTIFDFLDTEFLICTNNWFESKTIRHMSYLCATAVVIIGVFCTMFFFIFKIVYMNFVIDWICDANEMYSDFLTEIIKLRLSLK